MIRFSAQYALEERLRERARQDEEAHAPESRFITTYQASYGRGAPLGRRPLLRARLTLPPLPAALGLPIAPSLPTAPAVPHLPPLPAPPGVTRGRGRTPAGASVRAGSLPPIPLPAPMISGSSPETFAPVDAGGSLLGASRSPRGSSLLTLASRFLGGLFVEGDFLGTAYVIGEREILCARHCLNYRCVAELCFEIAGRSIEVEALLEDGATLGEEGEEGEDFAILRLKERVNPERRLHLWGETPAPNTDFTCVGYSEEKSPIHVTGSIPADGDAYTLGVFSFIDTQPGYSGALYLTQPSGSELHAFGMHLKTSDDPIFGGGRTGLSFSEIKARFPATLLARCIYTRPEDYERVQGCLRAAEPIPAEEEFPFFSTTVEGLAETEEKTRRDFIFGPTPSGMSKPTVIEVLKRWESKREPKARYIGNRPAKKYKVEEEKKWEIYVSLSGDKTKGRTWCQFGTKHLEGEKKKPSADYHMGHKLGCVRYWNEGARPYIEERCANYKRKLEEKRTPAADIAALVVAKRAKLKQRYAEFMDPVKGFYSQSGAFQTKMTKFMTCSQNYAFEFFRVNKSNGAKERKIWKYVAPTGYVWKKEEKDFSLVRFRRR